MRESKNKWTLLKPNADIEKMSAVMNLSKPVCAYLSNRGLNTRNSVLKYLNAGRRFLGNTSLLKDVDKAAEIIVSAIERKDKITVYGDYDADGVTSSVILVKALSGLGANVSYYIPQREEEGYGLNESSVVKLNDEGCRLIITCDNGIAALDEIKLAKSLGMNVVVIDHHEPGFSVNDDGSRTDCLPVADAVIDPKQNDCPYPFKHLCAGGLTYKFVKYLYEKQNRPFAIDDELLIFAAVATVCDVVDLTGENRIIVKNGLELINSPANANLGLKALMSLCRLNGKRIGIYELGFILGPCINATGRLEHASAAADLFLCKSQSKVENYARRLVDLNNERKYITKTAFDKIMKNLADSEFQNDKVLVIYDDTIHESVCGIVAGRVKEYAKKPCIVLTKSGDFVKGSGRSIQAYNMFEELYRIKDLFTRFGGHHMAAGLSMEEKNISDLRLLLNQNTSLTEDDFISAYEYDMELDLSDVTHELASEINLLTPFGKGNPAPLFASYGVCVTSADILGENKNTLKFTLAANRKDRLTAIFFAGTEKLKEKLGDEIFNSIASGSGKLKLDMLYSIEINTYNGKSSVQPKLTDFNIL